MEVQLEPSDHVNIQLKLGGGDHVEVQLGDVGDEEVVDALLVGGCTCKLVVACNILLLSSELKEKSSVAPSSLKDASS